MQFNLYQISSEDAAFVLLIKAEIRSLLISFDQARVKGRLVDGSNLIKSESSEVCVLLFSSMSNSVRSPGKKCFNLFTLSDLILLFGIFNLGTASFTLIMIACPMYFGANFLFFPKKSVCAYNTCCPMEKSCGLAFLSC